MVLGGPGNRRRWKIYYHSEQGIQRQFVDETLAGMVFVEGRNFRN